MWPTKEEKPNVLFIETNFRIVPINLNLAMIAIGKITPVTGICSVTKKLKPNIVKQRDSFGFKIDNLWNKRHW